MKKSPKVTKILATAGLILVWFPLLLPFLFGAIRYVESGRLNIDFLIPAEIFFVPFTGSSVLLWAAVRAKSRRKLIAWSLAAMVFFLVVSQVAAVVTGLADGSVQMGGWQSTLVFALFGGFLAALVVLAAAGILLLRELYRPQSENP